MAKNSQAAERKKGSYPYYLLKQCIRLGEVVRDHGGERAGVPRSVVAAGLESEQSAISQLVASAKIYGIVEGVAELKLTDTGREYFFPTADNGKRLAELQFLYSPSTFAYIVDKFDGSRLPSVTILGNLLGKDCGVSVSWRARAAQMFLSGAADLGVLDQSGVLRYAATKHVAASQRTVQGDNNRHSANEPDVVTLDPEPTAAPVKQTHERQNAQSGGISKPTSIRGSNVWSFTDRENTVRVETPLQLTRSLWKRLEGYVKLIEPTPEPTEGAQSGGTE